MTIPVLLECLSVTRTSLRPGLDLSSGLPVVSIPATIKTTASEPSCTFPSQCFLQSTVPLFYCRSVFLPALFRIFEMAHSVQEAAAALGSTVAAELVAGILDGELVVVGELFATVDLA